jgi:carbamoyl-phosphate synthase small subunit
MEEYQQTTPAILVLEDGTVFHGKAAGKIGTTTGEICFNTGMTGYQEIFTDPSYYGQILVATNAHIGNYGTKHVETESESIKIAGLICKNFTNQFSRKQADLSIQEYFEKENLVGISDVDTRAIVRHIRHRGAMNAVISSEILDVEVLKRRLRTPPMEGLELAGRGEHQRALRFRRSQCILPDRGARLWNKAQHLAVFRRPRLFCQSLSCPHDV